MFFEIKRRIANTEAGKIAMELDRLEVLSYAYGSMYLSMRQGQPFNRVEIPVCTIMTHEFYYDTGDEE